MEHCRENQPCFTCSCYIRVFSLTTLYTQKSYINIHVFNCKLIMHHTKTISRWYLSYFGNKVPLKRYCFVSKKCRNLRKKDIPREKPRNGKSKVMLLLRSVLQRLQVTDKTSPDHQGNELVYVVKSSSFSCLQTAAFGISLILSSSGMGIWYWDGNIPVF